MSNCDPASAGLTILRDVSPSNALSRSNRGPRGCPSHEAVTPAVTGRHKRDGAPFARPSHVTKAYERPVCDGPRGVTGSDVTTYSVNFQKRPVASMYRPL